MAVRMWTMLMLVAMGAVASTAQTVTTIYGAVAADAQFSTLKVLIDALNGNDATQSVFDDLNDESLALTVFAPNNTAIVKYIENNFGTVAEAVQNPEFVASLLAYHVLGAKVMSSDLTVDQVVTTLLTDVTFTVSSLTPPTLTTASSQTVLFNQLNIEVGSSVIHIVADVLDPYGAAWMFGGETRLLTTAAVAGGTTAENVGPHTILVQVLTALGEPYLGLATGTANKLMVVAPNDAAFAKFVGDANTTLDALLAETDMATLKNVINYHVFYSTDATVQANYGLSPNPLLTSSSTTWTAGAKIEMLNKEMLTVSKSGDVWTLVTSSNQTVVSSLVPTASGFVMPTTAVLAPVPAEETSGASSYHLSVLTVAVALMAVFMY